MAGKREAEWQIRTKARKKRRLGSSEDASILHEYTRECLALEVARGITGEGVGNVLAYLFEAHGEPEFIRSDSCPTAGQIRGDDLTCISVDGEAQLPPSPVLRRLS